MKTISNNFGSTLPSNLWDCLLSLLKSPTNQNDCLECQTEFLFKIQVRQSPIYYIFHMDYET